MKNKLFEAGQILQFASISALQSYNSDNVCYLILPLSSLCFAVVFKQSSHFLFAI